MLFNFLIFVKLLFIQITVSQCLPRSLHQNGQHFIPQSPKNSRRCRRQTNPLPAELAMTNIPTNVMPVSNPGIQNSPCDYKLSNGLATNSVLQNNLPNNGIIPNINQLNNAMNMPIGLQYSPNDYSFPNSIETNNIIRNSLPNNGLIPNINGLNNANMPIGNLGLQNSPCDYRLRNNLATNNILPNSLQLNMPSNGLVPNANGFNNVMNVPVNNGMTSSNEVTFSNNMATNNFMPNAYNGPLIYSIPNSNGNVFNENNMPAVNFLPIMNIPLANSVPNLNNLSPPNIAPLNMPASIPVNSNLVNNNNLPINNILPSGTGMLPNGLANSPQNNLPIANGYYLPANNVLVNSNNNNGCVNLRQNNMPTANSLQNMNNLPITNNFPNINCLNNLPVSNGITAFNTFPTNVIANNGLPFANNNIPFSNNVQFVGPSNINNPSTISNNMPLQTIFPNINSLPGNVHNNNMQFLNNDRLNNEGFNAINGVPNGGLLNNNLLLPNNVFFNHLPIENNWPCNNKGVNSALQQNVLRNASPVTNIQLENQLAFAKDLTTNLQIEGFGNLPLLNGLPIAGITETVTLLNTPCS